MKGRWESNINLWFPFMYSQRWNCYFQNRLVMFCLPVPTRLWFTISYYIYSNLRSNIKRTLHGIWSQQSTFGFEVKKDKGWGERWGGVGGWGGGGKREMVVGISHIQGADDKLGQFLRQDIYAPANQRNCLQHSLESCLSLLWDNVKKSSFTTKYIDRVRNFCSCI